jgi:hypothetical protein
LNFEIDEKTTDKKPLLAPRSGNPKRVLSHAEGSEIRNPKFLMAQIIGQDQHFDGIQLFQTGVVRNKKSSVPINSRGNL